MSEYEDAACLKLAACLKFCKILELRGGELLEGVSGLRLEKDGRCFALKAVKDLENVADGWFRKS